MSIRSERIVVTERQRCPRRDEGLGMMTPGEDVDAWERGRWAANQAEADAEVAEFMAAHPNGGHHGQFWRWPGEQPRTCSYCGGIHPDDATALVAAGWRAEGTDKSYKRYMEPPSGDGHISPPVKLYVQHFDAEQRDAFNRALRGGV